MEVAPFEEVEESLFVTSIVLNAQLGITIFLSEPVISLEASYPGVKVQFDLTNYFTLDRETLTKKPNSIAAANTMLTPPISTNAQICYTPVIKSFQEFCKKNGYPMVRPDESHLVEYLAECYDSYPIFEKSHRRGEVRCFGVHTSS